MFAEWIGKDLLFNALVFDDAQSKEDFLNNKFLIK